MKMTPKAVVIGSLLILGVIVFVVVILPYATRIEAPSDIFRERTAHEAEGQAYLHRQRLCVLPQSVHPVH